MTRESPLRYFTTVSGKRIESVGVPMQDQNEDIPDIYEMPRNSLDLTFSKKIGKAVEIKAGIQDMLNSKIEYKQFVKLTDKTAASVNVNSWYAATVREWILMSVFPSSFKVN